MTLCELPQFSSYFVYEAFSQASLDGLCELPQFSSYFVYEAFSQASLSSIQVPVLRCLSVNDITFVCLGGHEGP